MLLNFQSTANTQPQQANDPNYAQLNMAYMNQFQPPSWSQQLGNMGSLTQQSFSPNNLKPQQQQGQGPGVATQALNQQAAQQMGNSLNVANKSAQDAGAAAL